MWFQPHTARVTRNVYDVNGSLYWDSHQSCIHLQIFGGICTVLTADPIATGEVNCCNCPVCLCTLQLYGDDCPGVYSVATTPGLMDDGITGMMESFSRVVSKTWLLIIIIIFVKHNIKYTNTANLTLPQRDTKTRRSCLPSVCAGSTSPFYLVSVPAALVPST